MTQSSADSTGTRRRGNCAQRPRGTCGRWRASTRGCATTSGRRSAPSSPSGAGRWWCSGPAGASRRCTSSRPRCCARAAPGPTVIVSPLLALMRNQVEAAARAGIHARTINSANLEEWEQVHAEIRAGAVDVLLVSPERLNNPGFRDNVLPQLTADRRADRDRRGALHLRLGPRLPARLPADQDAARRPCRRTSRCWPPPRPPTPGSPTDVAEQLGAVCVAPTTDGGAGAARVARPGVAAAGGGEPARRADAAGLARRRTWAAARCRTRGSSTR